MEVMEDGNLMDKVLILIKRDFEYYKANQTVLQETICPGVTGGRLDFPRYASFAAVKLVLWWEDEFLAGFRKNSGLIGVSAKPTEDLSATEGVKSSNPDKFVSLIAKSAEELLNHLHVLTQEALDHSDLGVLMGTIGATVLLKNCLWFYIQQCTHDPKLFIEPIQKSYKEYQEMGEALAERLLDVHCRLLSLYILQDAESLDWENTKPFFESERGSYVIQMWWLYMQGTKEELWKTIPPKMAQTVLAGMLNESLTILTVRYMQASASESRTKLLIVDISNLLLCVGQLLPCISSSTEEVIGLMVNSHSKVVRDIHAKCQELFVCLVLRAAPLDILHKAFRKGTDSIEMLKSRSSNPSPWILLGLPDIFSKHKTVTKLRDLPDNSAIALELFQLLAQPQCNWALLLKILCMRNGKIASLLLNASKHSASEMPQNSNSLSACGGFLCNENCKSSSSSSYNFEMQFSLTYILLQTSNASEISSVLLPFIEGLPSWFQYFDRRQVWNLNHPPWYSAILAFLKPYLEPISSTVITAVQSGASMYQAMTIILACYIQLWDCIHPAVPLIANLIQEILPVDVTPMGKSPLLQLLTSAMYGVFLQKANKKEVKFAGDAENSKKPSVSNASEQGIALILAESLCSIDEDDKHTEEIEELLDLSNRLVESNGCKHVEESLQMAEALASNLLLTGDGSRSLNFVYHYLCANSEWLLHSLGVKEATKSCSCQPNQLVAVTDKLLEIMFYVGCRPFDQLLTGDWLPDWYGLLQIPLGLSKERIWNQVSLRWEFVSYKNSASLTREAKIVADLTAILEPV